MIFLLDFFMYIPRYLSRFVIIIGIATTTTTVVKQMFGSYHIGLLGKTCTFSSFNRDDQKQFEHTNKKSTATQANRCMNVCENEFRHTICHRFPFTEHFSPQKLANESNELALVGCIAKNMVCKPFKISPAMDKMFWYDVNKFNHMANEHDGVSLFIFFYSSAHHFCRHNFSIKLLPF